MTDHATEPTPDELLALGLTHDFGQLPATEWVLHMPARPYDPAWTSSESGYEASQVLDYAKAEVVAAVLKERQRIDSLMQGQLSMSLESLEQLDVRDCRATSKHEKRGV